MIPPQALILVLILVVSVCSEKIFRYDFQNRGTGGNAVIDTLVLYHSGGDDEPITFELLEPSKEFVEVSLLFPEFIISFELRSQGHTIQAIAAYEESVMSEGITRVPLVYKEIVKDGKIVNSNA